MTDSTASLRHQIGIARDLQSVVRTMRALAASSINQYEQSVLALQDYSRTVSIGLGACLREAGIAVDTSLPLTTAAATTVGVIVFGSDQGLVGRFNEVIVEYAVDQLTELPPLRQIWAVGERVQARLIDAGLSVTGHYPVPSSVDAIASLVDQLLIDAESHHGQTTSPHIHIFFNRPVAEAQYEPIGERLLPLDASWRTEMMGLPWPTANPPEVMGKGTAALRALIREHLFISLFRACAASLASENASRLAAMQRADKNIDELLTNLHGKFHSLRQSSIDGELFDVTAGYRKLSDR